MPYKDIEKAREYKRNWYRKKNNVTKFRGPQDGRWALDKKQYSREWYRAKAVKKKGFVHLRCSNDMDPRERLELRSCYAGDCIVWTGASHKLGYGHLYIGGRFFMAHRVAYELANGPIPDGLHLDHLCRNPPCINPAHLEAVTPAENVRRGEGANVSRRMRVSQTHCKRGHEFTEENTYTYFWNGTQRRSCKACWKARKLE